VDFRAGSHHQCLSILKCPNDSQLYVAGFLYGTVSHAVSDATPGLGLGLEDNLRTYGLGLKRPQDLALTTARTIFSITVEFMQDNNFFYVTNITKCIPKPKQLKFSSSPILSSCQMYCMSSFLLLSYTLAVWLSGNALASIYIVALHQTRLVPEWVTVCGRGNHLCM